MTVAAVMGAARHVITCIFWSNHMKLKSKETSLDRRGFLLLTAAGGTALVATPSFALVQDAYELVIAGGRVIDPESGFDKVANIAISDGEIAAISEQPLSGKKTINAAGLIVSPGFIDLHAHGQNISAYRLQAMQGVTTALELESGCLPIAEWYASQSQKKLPINYGASAGWTFARIAAFQNSRPEATAAYFANAQSDPSWKNEIATDDQMGKILELVKKGLEEGALGIGVNAGYAPGYGRREYYMLAELAKKYSVGTYTHMRYTSMLEPQSTFEAIQELIGLAAITNAKMHICHINSNSLKDIDATLELFERARANGIPVTAGAYPWGAASTVIGAAMFDGDQWRKRMGFDESAFIIGERRLNPETWGEIRKQNPGAFVSYFQLDESKPEELRLLDKSVVHPDVLIESDAMPWYLPNGKPYEGDEWPVPSDVVAHPRSSGTFAKILASYVRERKLLSVQDAIKKMSLMPAQTLESYVPQMKKKGRLQVGMDADVAIFDLETVKPMGTYAKPYRPASGFKHVLVGGVQVVDDGELVVAAAPGKPIRR